MRHSEQAERLGLAARRAQLLESVTAEPERRLRALAERAKDPQAEARRGPRQLAYPLVWIAMAAG